MKTKIFRSITVIAFAAFALLSGCFDNGYTCTKNPNTSTQSCCKQRKDATKTSDCYVEAI